MITFQTAKDLKDAGYPQTLLNQGAIAQIPKAAAPVHVPTLEELLGACGRGTVLDFYSEDSSAASVPAAGVTAQGATPSEALARLWIKLHLNNAA